MSKLSLKQGESIKISPLILMMTDSFQPKTILMTPSEQQLILASIARMIQSNQVNSFEELNKAIKPFDLELKSVENTDTYFSELLENLEKRKLELTQ